jgi:alcohol dehydrogenase class IV
MDALCQAIESFWSTNSTDESRIYSKQAIELIMPNIIKNVNNPDIISREKILVASNLAGKAINIAKTTAAHSVSYPITSYFNTLIIIIRLLIL